MHVILQKIILSKEDIRYYVDSLLKDLINRSIS
jgi:hypothetical protein